MLAGVVVAMSRIEPGLPSLDALLAACRRVVPLEPRLGLLLVLALGSLALIVLALAARSLARQLHLQRRFLRGLTRSNAIEVQGREVIMIESARPEAFCTGFLRPQIYLSTAARERLSEAELRAVVAHEAHHQRTRDPLRILLATVAAEALFFLPVLRRLSARYRELAELAADEAAGKAEGARTLAAALLIFGERAGETAPVVGIAPERVDHLLGHAPGWRLPLSAFSATLIILSGLVALALTAPGVVASESFGLAALLAELCMAAMVGVLLAVGAVLLGLSRSPQRLRLGTPA